MAKRTINLEEIAIHSFIQRDSGFDFKENYDPLTQKLILQSMKEACKQALELAAENAELSVDGVYYKVTETYDENMRKVTIKKESILNTINQIE